MAGGANLRVTTNEAVAEGGLLAHERTRCMEECTANGELAITFVLKPQCSHWIGHPLSNTLTDVAFSEIGLQIKEESEMNTSA